MNRGNEGYRSRVIDAELERLLQAVGAVVIEGPKACGKTESARRIAGSFVSLDRDRNALQAAELAPAQLLRGDTPIVLDEWQLAPNLWNEVRHEVDGRSPAKGQFILTGSSTPDDDVRRHSGAGRFARLQMRPMSLSELGHSSNEVSLGSLLEGTEPSGRGKALGIEVLCEIIAVDGWPGLLESSVADALLVNQDYLDQIVEVDLPRLNGTHRDPQRLRKVVAALARVVGNQRSVSKLAAEAVGSDGALDRNTVSTYLDELTHLRILEDLPAWNAHLRSRQTLAQQPKRMFVDPSLVIAALGASPEMLLADLEYLGFLFENLVVRDLRVLAQPYGGMVSHAHTTQGHEVDAIIERRDGTWAAFEIKLGHRWIDAGAASLKKLTEHVDSAKSGEPASLAVIVPDGIAYRRDDGVDVIPLSALGL